MFTVFGEGFDDETEIYISKVKSYTVPEYTDAEKILCEKVDADKDGQSVTCRMPKEADYTVYNLWAVNKYGVSNAKPLNGARPQWATVDSISIGQEFKVVGKNMSSSAFGGRTPSSVVLYNGVQEYFLDITEENEFALTVRCPENVPTGEYDIYVTNNSKTWFKIEDGRKIYVSKKVYDPLNLGVQWADKFNWNNILRVEPNTGGDSTVTLQNAIDTVSTNGGGVVELCEGQFNISELTIKEGVVLKGSGKDSTVIKDIGDAEYLIHLSVQGIQGICNLQIISDRQNKSAAIECYVNRWNSANASRRAGQYYFIKNVKGILSDTAEIKSYPFLAFCCKSHVLIDGCDISGYQANLKSTYISEYAYLRNNHFSTVIGNTILVAAYADIENNYIERRAIDELKEGERYTQGIFTRGPSYVAENVIKNMGSKDFNDGEIICTEDNADYKINGTVSGVNGNVISVKDFDEAYSDWEIGKVTWGEPYIVINYGRGLGQYRKIISYDQTNKTVTVDKPFTITPNDESQITIAPFNINVTMYDNYAENTSKGYWLYGYTLDSVICNNTGINTEGAFNVSKFRVDEDNKKEESNIGYFVRMNNNMFEGNSTRTGNCGVGAWNKILTDIPGERQCLGIYGLEISGNTIIPNKDSKVSLGYSEAYQNSGIYLVLSDKKAEKNDAKSKMKAVIIENNTIKDSKRGISIEGFGGMSDNICVGDNVFENVDNPILDARTNKSMCWLNSLNIENIIGKPLVTNINSQRIMYVGVSGGLYAYNISDESNPFVIQQISDDTLKALCMLKNEGALYIANSQENCVRKYNINSDGSLDEMSLIEESIPEFDYQTDMKIVDQKYLFISHKGDKEAISIFDISSEKPVKKGAITSRSSRAISKAGKSVTRFDILPIGSDKYRIFAVNYSSYYGQEIAIRTVDLSSETAEVTNEYCGYIQGSGIESKLDNPCISLINKDKLFIGYSDNANKNYTGDIIDISNANNPSVAQQINNTRCSDAFINNNMIYISSPDGNLTVYLYSGNTLLLCQPLTIGEPMYSISTDDEIIAAFSRNKINFVRNLK